MRRPPFLPVLLLLAAAFLAAFAARAPGAPARARDLPTCKLVAEPAPRNEVRRRPAGRLDAGRAYDAIFATSCGSFTVRLATTVSPNVTASFVALARSGFYDHTIFHRIVPGFVIQGGDPTASGDGGPGYRTIDRPPAGLRYTVGIVAMAKAPNDPRGAAGSQFFVATGPLAATLPPDYALLGRVTKGLAVVQAIGELGYPDDPLERPTQIVTIDRVTIKES